METLALCPQASSAGSLTSSIASSERLWKEEYLLTNPSQYRKSDTNPGSPDFKQRPWMDGCHNQSRPKDMLSLQKTEESWPVKGSHIAQPQAMMKKKKDDSSRWEILSLEQALASLETGSLPQPSVDDFACILHKCRKERNREYALRLHAHMRSCGLETHASLGNNLVSILVEVGSICDAHQVFDRMLYRNECSWNLLIIGYVECGESQNALILYQKMQEDDSVHPSRHAFVALLKACAKLKDLERGHKIHTEIARKGLLTRDLFVGSSLVDMYAKCGSLEKAQEVFDNLPVQDVVLWNALIGGYAKQGRGEEALSCLEQMQIKGLSPNVVTFVCSLKACSSIGATGKGQEIHAQVARNGLLESEIAVGNALVDMYAKCGLLANAQQVFDKLRVRDVISWTALITGYANCSCSEEALACFEQMQLEGISPNTVTFACILKACGSIGAADIGQQIHAEIARLGLEKDHLVGTAVVDMYAKCGFLVEAQELFDKLLVQDVVSWNALIAGYAKHERGDEALKCFRLMQQNGIFPDAITFVCSLKACGSTGAADEGRDIHAEIARKGLLKRDIVVGNALVDMYAKCGLLVKAQEVFDKLSVRNVVSWNALIAGYAEHERGEEALNCFKQMQVEGHCPNAVTFVCSLKACGTIGALDRGREIHAEISKKGLEKDFLVGSTLVDMYCKCGLLAKAQEVFDNLPVRDVISWTALIAGYVEHGLCEKALICFEQMQHEGVSPDVVTFAWSLKACGSIGATDKGQEIHAQIGRDGLLERDPAVGNALVDMYAKCGSLAKAQEVFDKLSVQEVVSWSTLIAGYAEHGHGEKALNCFEQMQLQGISPTSVTFVCILKACGRIGATDKGLEIYAQIARTGLERDFLVGSALVDMFAKCGLLAEAQEVFEKLPVRDAVLWTALIAGYAEHGRCEEALTCFEQMQHEGISPDAATFVCSLKACGSIGAIDKGKEMHGQISRTGFLERDIVVGNALVDMYAKCGLPAKAQEVFDELPVRDIVAWTSLIAGYAQLGENENVSRIFDSMIGEGRKPNGVTFLSILNACCHAGLVDKGQTYFEAMSKDYGIVPTLEHHTCMVDLLGRAGQLDKAVAMIKKMPLDSNLVVWQAVLGACQKWGNVELGKQAFEHAVLLDEKDAAAYVCMSNIFADAGIRGDANEVEAMRVKKQSWKKSGQSC